MPWSVPKSAAGEHAAFDVGHDAHLLNIEHRPRRHRNREPAIDERSVDERVDLVQPLLHDGDTHGHRNGRRQQGGNLGLTQRGRVEFARGGGRVNTDAIDNTAGVNCSDNEVNIKILDRVVRDDDLTAEQRDGLLVAKTDDVAARVLGDNDGQTLALSIAASHSATMGDVHTRHLDALERSGASTGSSSTSPAVSSSRSGRVSAGG
jgi:hypothetical protein